MANREPPSGVADDRDIEIMRLRAEVARLRGASLAGMSGMQAAKARRLERVMAVQRIFRRRQGR